MHVVALNIASEVKRQPLRKQLHHPPMRASANNV
jgi:hypothetical protein